MRVIRSRGTPFERGSTVGAALRDEIERRSAFTMAWAADLGADRTRVEELLGPTTRSAPASCPI